MSTATRALPAHGTYARANGSHGYRPPCNCPPCRAVWNRTRKQQRVNRALGRPALVDSARARTHLATLTATMTWIRIAEKSGCSVSHLKTIAAGRMAQIRPTTERRILNTHPDPTDTGKQISPLGAMRRIQALYVLGHGHTAIHRATGISGSFISRIANGRAFTIDIATARRIAAAYAQLIQRQGTSARARRIAAQNGWHGPMVWGDIDNPTAKPEPDPHLEIPAALVHGENGEWLLRQGYSLDHAAQRLGVTRRHLDRCIAEYRATQREAAA